MLARGEGILAVAARGVASALLPEEPLEQVGRAVLTRRVAACLGGDENLDHARGDLLHDGREGAGRRAGAVDGGVLDLDLGRRRFARFGWRGGVGQGESGADGESRDTDDGGRKCGRLAEGGLGRTGLAEHNVVRKNRVRA